MSLLIKKLTRQKDVDALCQHNPAAEKSIFGANANGMICPYEPENEPSFWKKLFDKKELNAFYFIPGIFSLPLEGNISNGGRTFAISLTLKIASWDFVENMSRIIDLLDADGELTEESLAQALEKEKRDFFDYLNLELAKTHEGTNITDQIKKIANREDWMGKFFPWFKIDGFIVKSEAILTEQEQQALHDLNLLAKKKQTLEQELKRQDAESAYRITLSQIENNEAEAIFAAQLQEKERQTALLQKDAELKHAVEIGELNEKQAKEEMLLKIAETQKNRQCAILDEQLKRAQTEAEIRKLDAQKELDEKEYDVEKLRIQRAFVENEQKLEELRRQGENKLLELSVAEGRLRNLQTEEECRRETIRLREKLEQEKLQAEIARTRADKVYFDSRVSMIRQKLNHPDLTFASEEAASSNVTPNDLLRYERSSIIAMLQDQQKKENGKLKISSNAVSAVSRGVTFRKQFRMMAGAEMWFHLEVPQSGYLSMICIEADGTFQLIVPNGASLEHDCRISTGSHMIPDEQGPYLPIAPLTQTGRVVGDEYIVAIVSSEPLFSHLASVLNDQEVITLTQVDICDMVDRLSNGKTGWSTGFLHYLVEQTGSGGDMPGFAYDTKGIF